MSRIGRMPIAIPAGVEVKIDGSVVTVKGAKATLTREFHPNMTIAVDAQVIDDVAGVTLVSASTAEKSFTEYGGNKEAAKKIGQIVAERCKAKGIETVVFDRGGYVFHGRVKELADGAREGGLQF